MPLFYILTGLEVDFYDLPIERRRDVVRTCRRDDALEALIVRIAFVAILR